MKLVSFSEGMCLSNFIRKPRCHSVVGGSQVKENFAKYLYMVESNFYVLSEECHLVDRCATLSETGLFLRQQTVEDRVDAIA